MHLTNNYKLLDIDEDFNSGFGFKKHLGKTKEVYIRKSVGGNIHAIVSTDCTYEGDSKFDGKMLFYNKADQWVESMLWINLHTLQHVVFEFKPVIHILVLDEEDQAYCEHHYITDLNNINKYITYVNGINVLKNTVYATVHIATTNQSYYMNTIKISKSEELSNFQGYIKKFGFKVIHSEQDLINIKGHAIMMQAIATQKLESELHED